MTAFMIQLLRCSVSMTAVALLYALVATLFKKRYSPTGFYYAGGILLLGFMIPFRPIISVPILIENVADEVSLRYTLLQNSFVIPFESVSQHEFSASITKNTFIAPIQIAFIIWLLGVVVVFLYQGIQHAYFIKTIRRWSTEITDQQTLEILEKLKLQTGISAHLNLMLCPCISSPMLVYMFYPIVLLPDIHFSADELKFILHHEIVHFKRNDFLFKGALILAVAINWFNPVIYLFARLFLNFCELSCDEIVTKKQSKSVRHQYAMTIIRIAHLYSKQKTVFLTFFNGGKNTMKNRIFSIMSTSKKRSGVALLLICLILTLSAGTAFASKLDLAKSDAKMEREIQDALTEEFNNEFNEDDFPGMIITYDEDGIPIVTDPNTILSQAVTTTTRYEKNGFYSASSCSDAKLVFYILKNKTVTVTDSSYTTTVAKVKYANTTGYMKKSQLKF